MLKDAQEPQCSVELHAIRSSPCRRQYFVRYSRAEESRLWSAPHGLGKFSLVLLRQKFAVLKALGNCCVNRHCQGRQGVPLGMHRVNPETSNPEPSDPFVTADILLREEPEDEKDEEEHEGGEENDDEDDGYSE
jgi:hypothetical protein